MHFFRVALLAVLLSACSLTSSPTVSSAPADDSTTTSAPAVTTTVEAETATTTTLPPASGTLETVGCDDATEPFVILCEAVETISIEYVDPIAFDELAIAAVRGVEEFATPDMDGELLRCAIPNEDFLPVCEALDETDPTPLEGVEAAIQGMVQFALDPNSAYLDPQALALEREDRSGSVEGIGALVNTEDRATDDPAANPCPVITENCRMVIVSTFDGSPADDAGLEPGDEFVAVDGEPILGMSLVEITNLVRGPAGSPVVLDFLRDGEPFRVTIERAAIDIPIAEWEVIGTTGYLRLNLFTNNADEVVREALEELFDDGAERIVFDLRNNPGGSLTSSVNIASEFLADGLVLRTQSPAGEVAYEVEPGGVATRVPVTILVNRGSASASEVVTGALQEAGRATVVGENTFGKNTVQQQFVLSNGGAIKVTIARWVTPAGDDFGQVGLAPDIRAEIPTELTVEEILDLVNTLVP